MDFVQARAEALGIQISFAEPADVTVPAYAGTVNLRYARPVESAAAVAGPSRTPVHERHDPRRREQLDRRRSWRWSSACCSSSSSGPRAAGSTLDALSAPS